MTPQVRPEDVDDLLGGAEGAVLVLRGSGGDSGGVPEVVVTEDEGEDLLVTTRAALVRELGDRPDPEAVARAAAALTDVVAKLGA
ncbi:hypothetical protein [Rhodococcoides kroppenstedtii]|uniref:hypothetical protein n=1 Tax=Rhodococcoides kroppenstedtii TaxID=293050 RepID=UPI001BDE154D|nr:hypothetical protein [Rhodococcus kroppenstedtii]MBT1191827.1 hypothetical protein [Rhodococcus kroppenstedtii]